MTKRVLVAEDEPNIAESLSFLLGRAGFDVHVVTDGRVALENAISEPPDLLVLDVMLPSLDGYQVLRGLRAEGRTKGLPVLILTAKGQREDRETALDAGANKFITKPFTNAEIVAAVEELTAA